MDQVIETQEATKPLPAATEISPEASAKVDALAAKQDRSRAYILRQIIHAWAVLSASERHEVISRKART